MIFDSCFNELFFILFYEIYIDMVEPLIVPKMDPECEILSLKRSMKIEKRLLIWFIVKQEMQDLLLK